MKIIPLRCRRTYICRRGVYEFCITCRNEHQEQKTTSFSDPFSLNLEYHMYGVRWLEISPAVGISQGRFGQGKQSHLRRCGSSLFLEELDSSFLNVPQKTVI